ncbi:MAG: DUF4153 domain-containing protein [Lachnospiraceae bacterium]|nr:DUF4153 domain-containing protein [Lachnospiraceae bacterium]
MERFGTFIKGAFSYPGKLRETRPVTTAGIIATTLLYAVYAFISSDYSREKHLKDPLDLLSHIALAILFFSVFSLFLESIELRKGRVLKCMLFGFFGVLSLFMSALTYDPPERFRAYRAFRALPALYERLGEYSVFSFIIGGLAIALLLAVFFSYSGKIGQDFNVHLMNCSSNIFFSLIIFGVIQIGVLLLFAIMEELLFHDAFDLFGSILILINGLFFAPAVICALINENEEANAFFRILVRYIMLILSLLSYVIIYAYILKLMITRSVPSNSVFSILTALFVITIFIAYLSTTFENKGLLQKFAYLAPLVFSPFILMQGYTVFVRIGQYGLTPKRYFGIAFILFEIVYITYYLILYKKEKRIAGKGLLIILCVFILVTVFIPGISAKSLSTIIAKQTLSDYLEKLDSNGAIPEKEYIRADAAAGFLQDSEYGRERLKKYFPQFSEEMRDELRAKKNEAGGKLKTGEDEYDIPSDGWYSTDLFMFAGKDGFDISGYDSIRYVAVREYGNTKEIDTSDLAVYPYEKEIEDRTGGPLIKADLSGFVRRFIDITVDEDREDYSVREGHYRDISVIDLDENTRLIITMADIRFDHDRKPEEIGIYGYLFQKKR